MRKAVTLFLLLVLSIQILPIRQMGSLLFSNQFTEEIPHSMDTDNCCMKKADIKSDFLSTPGFHLSSTFIDLPFQHLEFEAAIPANHTGEIHVPPPNGLS